MGLIGGVLGQIDGIVQNRRNEKMMEQQKRNQMELNEQGFDISKKMWEQTNYGAQVEQMKKAGLSTGLMYGKGGAGGATTSVGGGGSASMSQGAQSNSGGMALQAAGMQSQIELNKALANKANADATKTSTIDTEGGALDNKLKGQTMSSIVEKAFYDKEISGSENLIRGNQADISTATVDSQLIVKRNEAIISSLEIGLKEIGIEKTRAEIENMAEQIKIGKFNANINAEQMGLDKVSGTQLNNLINEIYERTGKKQYKTPQIK